MGFEKLFPARGRCGRSTHLQLTKPSCRRSRGKLCHPFGNQNTGRKILFLFFVGNTDLSRRGSLSPLQFILL